MKTERERKDILKNLIGETMPRLWCPPLTHYTQDGAFDKDRIAAHWAHITPYVKAFLVPGSTGDGWEMTDNEIITILDFSIDLAQEYDAVLLIGVLKTEVSRMRDVIVNTMSFLKKKTGLDTPIDVLKKARVSGFTVCPPSGYKLTQGEIQESLEFILELSLPTALYQLPQVTENEMSPELIRRLAKNYENFILMKDSSGADRVALQDKGRIGIFFVRGAEGNYSEWLLEGGGPYNGLLLSTGNCFAPQLKSIITFLEKGETKEARKISEQLTGMVDAVFEVVSTLDVGNPFTNANKAMDHFFAYGSAADAIPPPMLHAGIRLPYEILRKTAKILKKNNMIPEKGYMNT